MNKLITSLLLIVSTCFGQSIPLLQDGRWIGLTFTNPATGMQIYPAFESVYMTSDTSPPPFIVSASTEHSAPYATWKAFQSPSDAYYWTVSGTSYPQWIKHNAGTGRSNVVSSLRWRWYPNLGSFSNYTFQGSMDDSTYTTISSSSVQNVANQILLFNNSSYYQYHRMTFIDKPAAGDGYTRLYEFNLSSADYSSPIQTSTSTPLNIACDSIYDSSQDAWNCMDGDMSKWWAMGAASSYPHWIETTFSTNTVINGFEYTSYGLSSLCFSNYFITASLDRTNYVLLDSGTFPNDSSKQMKTNSNTTAYKYYKLTSSNGWTAGYAAVREMMWKHYK